MVSSHQLGQSIKNYRQKTGLTQDDLSDKAKLAYSTLAKIEQGVIKNPSIFTVYAIAKALGVEVEQLVNEVQSFELMPEAKSIKFIYCDINGVMVRFYHHAFATLADETGVPFDKVETTFWHYNDPVNRGEMTIEEFNVSMARHLGINKKIDWRRHYMDSVKPITEMSDFLNKLKPHYKIGLLSNIMPGFIDEMMKSGVLPNNKFDAIIDSSVVGAVKPEEKIYRLAEKAAGVSGGNIFFIDDSRANLTAAEQLGWRVFWFDDYDPADSIKRIEQALL